MNRFQAFLGSVWNFKKSSRTPQHDEVGNIVDASSARTRRLPAAGRSRAATVAAGHAPRASNQGEAPVCSDAAALVQQMQTQQLEAQMETTANNPAPVLPAGPSQTEFDDLKQALDDALKNVEDMKKKLDASLSSTSGLPADSAALLRAEAAEGQLADRQQQIAALKKELEKANAASQVEVKHKHTHKHTRTHTQACHLHTRTLIHTHTHTHTIFLNSEYIANVQGEKVQYCLCLA